MSEEVWILADDRAGTSSQSIGLAETLGLPYKIINLQYSFFINFPNCFFSSCGIRLSKKNRDEFRNLTEFPKIIITAGRRAATAALFLKKLSKNKSKTIQIMNPNLSFHKFDLVILPKHDGFNEKDFSNLITTIGALNRVSENKILQESQKFADEFSSITKPKIALLLGGSSKSTKFSEASAIKLAKISSKITKNMNATLLVLNSRRTEQFLTDAVKSSLDCDFRFFDWQEIQDKNPYFAILQYADFFIITGDSVSMTSECCFLGKPTYIFDEKNISSKKHRFFHLDLFKKNHAKKLDEDMEILEKFSASKLQETKRVAEIILSTIQ
jgi:mitochondrial fission protein ELM1